MKAVSYNNVKKSLKQFLEKLSQDFLCLMPELGYLSRREVASLAGVAPHPKESGKAVGYRRITGGRSNVRSKLFTAAMAAQICTWYLLFQAC